MKTFTEWKNTRPEGADLSWNAYQIWLDEWRYDKSCGEGW